MQNAFLSLLSREWAGLVLAAVAALVGVAAMVLAPADPSWVQWLGYAALLLAGLMAAGSVRHLLHMALVRKQYPAPGKLVDIGGYRVHVLAEGDARGKPPVVWMPGGHGAGFGVHHWHRMLRDEARSILIDRPGTGWSDPGPFPRTTSGEAVEMFKALEKAGESGPFILVGYSLGGLLVANMARQRPDLVSSLVLVDATPPDTILYGPPFPRDIKGMRSAALQAIRRLFGFHPSLPPLKPEDFDDKREDNLRKQLGPAVAAMDAIESGSKAGLAMASIRRVLTPRGMADLAWETAVYDGDLGDMPVFVVTPPDMPDDEFEAAWKTIPDYPGKQDDVPRARRVLTLNRDRYMAASTNSQRVLAPPGTTHFFGWEVPEFIVDVVRGILSKSGGSQQGS